ncbi:MAG: serine/threonine-protein kinase [Candidatus Eisenbacteria bacterium]|nr:serine/threonine-protein kinase [Candidatus Eisenbacteria bacterium]
MSIGPGTKIGPYDIVGPLGAGGMGEVWRGRDSRLGRDVAIKVLPAALAGDPERRARFERECRLLASLSHPHIASVLGLEDAGGAPALVMELVEGLTLADRLHRDGAIELGETLALARQIAEAVEFAHERGIVHRDLKPGNIKLTSGGDVKVLDFGLAKALAIDEMSPGSSQITQSPTMSVGTQAGVLLGTAAYMAPEQARGKAVDRRADIWAFGVVLYEMLTGRQMFTGETVSDTIARILERQPDWSALPARTPARVRELLRRCLDKDARQRLRDIGDARLELDAAIALLASGVSDAPASAAETRKRSPLQTLGAVGAGLLLGGLALAGGFALRGAVQPHEMVRASIVPPDDLVIGAMNFGQGDDRAMYASAIPRGAESRASSAIYRRTIGDFEWRKVAGSEGKSGWDMSLDGRWLYAIKPVAEGSRKEEVVRIPVDGSAPPVSVMPWSDATASWDVLPDGRVVAIERGQKRFAVISPGETSEPKWRDLKSDHVLGELSIEESLPDGKAALVVIGYYSSKGWTQSTAVLELESGKVEMLEENSGSPRLMPGGRLIMTRGGALLAAPWDAGRRRLRARPVAVMQGLRSGQAWEHARATSSPRGDLGVELGGATSQQRSLAIVHADGRVEPWSDDHRAFEQPPVVRPDGRMAAVIAVPPGSGNYEIVLLERGRPSARRFAAEAEADCRAPEFSPDGTLLAWAKQASDSTAGLYVQPSSGGAPARLVVRARSLAEGNEPNGWYPDGRSILVTCIEKGHSSLRRVTLSDESAVVTDVVLEKFDVYDGRVSPDGAHIAYVSNESGEQEVVVARLGADGRAGPAVPVSRGFGTHPRWADGGATLLWGTRGKQVMAVSVSANLDLSAPVRRADLSELVNQSADWAVMSDGSLLVTRKADGEGEIRRYDILFRFDRELKSLLAKATAGAR